jgi:hypothetical protein
VDLLLVADPGVRDRLSMSDLEGRPGKLRGQGNPLPKGVAYNAEWLLEPMIIYIAEKRSYLTTARWN